MRKLWTPWYAAVFATGVVLTGIPALAGPLTSAELTMDEGLLTGFNVISFGNYAQGSETEGSALIGGNLSGGKAGDFCFQNCVVNPTVSGLAYSSLTVFGTLSGTHGTGASGANVSIGNASGGVLGAGTSTAVINENNHGGVSVVGPVTGQLQNLTAFSTNAASGSVNFQNPPASQSYNLPVGTVFPYGNSIAPAQSALTDPANGAATLNQSLIAGGHGETLPANDGNNTYTPTANYTNGGLNYAIVNAPAGTIGTESNWNGINGSGLAAVIVVINDTGTVTLPNFNGNAGEGNVIFDFINATALDFLGTWYGTILAPNASISASGDLDGTVIGASINQTNEYHRDLAFTANLSGLPTGSPVSIPEPATLALLGVGLAGLGLARRRRA